MPQDLVGYAATGTILTGLVTALLRGWLVPGPIVRQVLDVMKERLADRDAEIKRLEAINEAEAARNDLLANQVREMVEANRTANAVVAALPAASRERSQ